MVASWRSRWREIVGTRAATRARGAGPCEWCRQPLGLLSGTRAACPEWAVEVGVVECGLIINVDLVYVTPFAVMGPEV